MINSDALKALEAAAEPTPVPRDRILYARLDGRAFSTLTRSIAKPRCAAFAQAMAYVAEEILRRSGAVCAYAQSDEISLLWAPAPAGGQHPFGGRILKIATTLAGEASALLQARLRADASSLADALPHFDARALGLSLEEAAAMIGWRAQDAWRNAVSAIAEARLPRRTLHGLDLAGRVAALKASGDDLSGHDPDFLHGLLLDMPEADVALDASQLAKIPPAHRPQGPVRRRILRRRTIARLWRVPNLAAVLFEGADPQESL